MEQGDSKYTESISSGSERGEEMANRDDGAVAQEERALTDGRVDKKKAGIGSVVSLAMSGSDLVDKTKDTIGIIGIIKFRIMMGIVFGGLSLAVIIFTVLFCLLYKG